MQRLPTEIEEAVLVHVCSPTQPIASPNAKVSSLVSTIEHTLKWGVSAEQGECAGLSKPTQRTLSAKKENDLVF